MNVFYPLILDTLDNPTGASNVVIYLNSGQKPTLLKYHWLRLNISIVLDGDFITIQTEDI